MKTFRLIALLALAALAACADPVTAPAAPERAELTSNVGDGTGFLGGGTRQ
jgi:hypothetical protein